MLINHVNVYQIIWSVAKIFSPGTVFILLRFKHVQIITNQLSRVELFQTIICINLARTHTIGLEQFDGTKYSYLFLVFIYNVFLNHLTLSSNKYISL